MIFTLVILSNASWYHIPFVRFVYMVVLAVGILAQGLVTFVLIMLPPLAISVAAPFLLLLALPYFLYLLVFTCGLVLFRSPDSHTMRKNHIPSQNR
jgi:hypothetical protein